MPPTPQDTEFTVFGRTLAAKRWRATGSAGVPTIALHGWLDNANSFDRLAPNLPGLDLLALDLVGHGHSDHLAPGTHYLSLTYLQDVLEVAAQLDWETFNLIGHSMGAGLAAELTGYFPKRIARVALIDGLLLARDTPAERTQINRYAMKQMLSGTRREAPLYRSLDEMARRVVASTDQSFATARLLVERAARVHGDGYTWRTDARVRYRTPLRMSQPEVTVLQQRATSPALLIVAQDSSSWRAGELAAHAKDYPNLSITPLPGPHHLHLEADFAGAVADCVAAFFEDQPKR